MAIFLSKVVASLLYPLGFFSLLFFLALLLALVGKRKIAITLFALGGGLIIVASLPVVARTLAGSLEQQFPPVAIENSPTADLIVVLGGVVHPPNGVRTETELAETSDRLLHAARLWRAGKAPRIFLSGGHVYDKFWNSSESFHAQQLLIEWGVPRSVVDIGEKSKTTRQNATEVSEYLQQQGIKEGRILLVTSATHMRRSVAVFKEHLIGENAIKSSLVLIPSPTDIVVTPVKSPGIFQWLPNAGALAVTTKSWHEYIGLWYYRLRGWANE